MVQHREWLVNKYFPNQNCDFWQCILPEELKTPDIDFKKLL